MFLLYCTDDDIAIVRAAAGGLAMLSHEPKIAHKIITVSAFFLVSCCRVFDYTYQYQNNRSKPVIQVLRYF